MCLVNWMFGKTAGDLLRAERSREGSRYGAMITEYITEGKIVPMEVTIKASALSPQNHTIRCAAPR